MKRLFHLNKTIIYFSALFSIGAGLSAELEAPHGHNDYCKHFSGHYIKPYGVVCCQNETFFNPFHYQQNVDIKTCAKELSKVKTDDLPAALWREHFCVLKASGVKDKQLATFKGFMGYMTSNYTEPLKSKILKSMEKCSEADAEKDESTRLKMFYLCMYKSERKVCHKPYAKLSDEVVQSAAPTKKYCKPDENFPLFGSHCCKGKPIPFPPHIFGSDLILYDIKNAKETEKCEKTYHDRQKTLSSKNKAGPPPTSCHIACQLTGTPFTSKAALKMDVEGLKKKLFSIFSPAVQKELLTRFDKYREVKMYNNGTYTFSNLVKLMTTSKDELRQIRFYCDLHTFIPHELEVLAIDDYCYDEAFAKEMGNLMAHQ